MAHRSQTSYSLQRKANESLTSIFFKFFMFLLKSVEQGLDYLTHLIEIPFKIIHLYILAIVKGETEPLSQRQNSFLKTFLLLKSDWQETVQGIALNALRKVNSLQNDIFSLKHENNELRRTMLAGTEVMKRNHNQTTKKAKVVNDKLKALRLELEEVKNTMGTRVEELESEVETGRNKIAELTEQVHANNALLTHFSLRPKTKTHQRTHSSPHSEPHRIKRVTSLTSQA